ncbi:hypothetical protein NHX12_007121 [Muraenolepis orangiensis]|uniref:Uncharacterized protein n=1 Tax=Muraenolepis orangiensis TaxID=630683 RepID=A0A9Q0DQR3_9TELE|nr:hypothetical protein NHX12_007121 [Muraenolepis orangiensis]
MNIKRSPPLLVKPRGSGFQVTSCSATDRGSLAITTDRGSLAITTDRGSLAITTDRGSLAITTDRGSLTITTAGSLRLRVEDRVPMCLVTPCRGKGLPR